MSVWYYADLKRNRQGPAESAVLARLFREGRLQLDSLVWREGLANWQPLGDFAAELGLLDEAGPTGLSPEPVESAPPDGNSPADFGRVVFASREREPAVASPYAAPASRLTGGEPIAYAGGRVVYAGFWKRYAALFIDNMIVFVVTMVSIVATMAVAGGVNAFAAQSTPNPGAIGVLLLSVYGIPILFQAVYFSWMHASQRQATLGKMAVGIKLARSDGQPVTLGRSVGRWALLFVIYLASCGLGTLVSAIWVAVSERKQALHDLACDTLVVDKWAFTAHPERQNDEVGSVTIVMIGLSLLFVFGYIALIIFSATLGGH